MVASSCPTRAAHPPFFFGQRNASCSASCMAATDSIRTGRPHLSVNRRRQVGLESAGPAVFVSARRPQHHQAHFLCSETEHRREGVSLSSWPQYWHALEWLQKPGSRLGQRHASSRNCGNKADAAIPVCLQTLIQSRNPLPPPRPHLFKRLAAMHLCCGAALTNELWRRALPRSHQNAGPRRVDQPAAPLLVAVAPTSDFGLA